MATIKNVQFGNGTIRFIGEVPSTPEGNNPAHSRLPAHYEATFGLGVDFSEGEISFRNIFSWDVIVLNSDGNATYRSIEDQAAKSIAPMLRALADEIDREIVEADKRRESIKV